MARKDSSKIIGCDSWVNERTGERRNIVEVEKAIGRQEHFMIAYLGEIINMIDSLGNKKMQVVKYVLTKMSKSNNVLLGTNREIAEETGLSYKTVADTLKIMAESGIIKRRVGSMMLNPHLMNNWRKEKEASMMITYREFGNNEPINITPKKKQITKNFEEQNMFTGEYEPQK